MSDGGDSVTEPPQMDEEQKEGTAETSAVDSENTAEEELLKGSREISSEDNDASGNSMDHVKEDGSGAVNDEVAFDDGDGPSTAAAAATGDEEDGLLEDDGDLKLQGAASETAEVEEECIAGSAEGLALSSADDTQGAECEMQEAPSVECVMDEAAQAGDEDNVPSESCAGDGSLDKEIVNTVSDSVDKEGSEVTSDPSGSEVTSDPSLNTLSGEVTSETAINEELPQNNDCSTDIPMETSPDVVLPSQESCSEFLEEPHEVDSTIAQCELEPSEAAASAMNCDTTSLSDTAGDSQASANNVSDPPENVCTHSEPEDKAANSTEEKLHHNQDNTSGHPKHNDISSNCDINLSLDSNVQTSTEGSQTKPDIHESNTDINTENSANKSEETCMECSPEPFEQMEVSTCDKQSSSDQMVNEFCESTNETTTSAAETPDSTADEHSKVVSEQVSDDSGEGRQSLCESMTSSVTDTQHAVSASSEGLDSSSTPEVHDGSCPQASPDCTTSQPESHDTTKITESTASKSLNSQTESTSSLESDVPNSGASRDSKSVVDPNPAAETPMESDRLSTSVESLGTPAVLASCKDSDMSGSTSSIGSLSTLSPCKSSTNSDDTHLLSELDAELVQSADSVGEVVAVGDGDTRNGLKTNVSLSCIPEYRELKSQQDMLQKTLLLQQEEIQRLKEDLKGKSSELETTTSERNKLKAQVETFQNNTQEDAYILQIKELENTIVDQKVEIKQNEDKLTNHDAAAKKAITTLQEQLKTKVDQLTKTYEDCRREKDTMVVKYAQAESRNLELQGHMTKMQMQMKEWMKEKEMMIQRFRQFKADKQKAVDAYEARTAELNAMRKELEKQKEQAHSASVSTKWAQNKLKAEGESHKETKWRLEETQRKLKQAKEETEMIRRDCQAMIKTYQESEEIKSSELDAKLKETQEELVHHQQEKNDQQEVHHVVKKELDTLKNKHKELIEELKTWKDKVKCLDTERQHQEETLTKFKATLQSQKNDNQELKQRLEDLEDVEIEIKDQKDKIETLQDQVEELTQTKEDLSRDMESYNIREIDHLEYTQKMSETNARLLSENTALSAKVKGLSAEVERLSEICEKLKENNGKLSKDLTEVTRLRSEETSSLTTQLNDKTKTVEDLSVKLEDSKDEVKTLKRKHTANTKDLTRQLHQAKKRLEILENKDATSMGSRTSSNNSLETINGQNQQNHRGSQDAATPPQEECPPIVEVVEVDKQMLVEKIVRLQRSHARKNEKLEFQEDHINQLLVEVKKKNKIIQSYVMREEAGTLTPDTMDINKAQMAKKMGIMASMYSHHPKDGEMSLDLSLEINHKLQGVLEDTLLKNITLKENLDTLGREIAQLSQENRQLQLKMAEDAEKERLEKPLQQ